MSHWDPVLGRQVSVPGSKLLSWGDKLIPPLIPGFLLWIPSLPNIPKTKWDFLDAHLNISSPRSVFFCLKSILDILALEVARSWTSPVSWVNQINQAILAACLSIPGFVVKLGIISSKKSGVKQNKKHLWEKNTTYRLTHMFFIQYFWNMSSVFLGKCMNHMPVPFLVFSSSKPLWLTQAFRTMKSKD